MPDQSNYLSSVPKQMRALLQSIIEITDEVCHKHLNAEYAALAQKAAIALARKRPSPLTERSKNTWACGIVYALGFVNFLFDKSTKPYLSATELCEAFNVSKKSGAEKSRVVRGILGMDQMDHKWCLPSRMDNNPLIWMIMIDGFMVDVRTAPREIQEIAFEKGLIPYVPNKA